MRLPNADQAIIDPRKVRDYLLSSEHPVGGYKAHLFTRVGFVREEWQEHRYPASFAAEPAPTSARG